MIALKKTIGRVGHPHSRATRRLGPLVAAALLAVAFTTSPGCSRWDMRGKGFDDDTGRMARRLRPPADEKQFSGLDTRAREIERNLGVR